MFEYRDGELFFKERPISYFKVLGQCTVWNKKNAGKRAGCYSGKYGLVNLKNYFYYVHRIIFLMHNGFLPKEIDHIDGNPKNNRIENLREVKGAGNQQNQKLSKKNTSGYKGVIWSKDKKKWRAEVGHKRKNIFLGYFANIEDAAKTARLAREVLHGEFARFK